VIASKIAITDRAAKKRPVAARSVVQRKKATIKRTMSNPKTTISRAVVVDEVVGATKIKKRPARGRNKKENVTESNAESDNTSGNSTASNSKAGNSNSKNTRHRSRNAGRPAKTNDSDVNGNVEPNGNVIPPEPPEIDDVNGNVAPSDAAGDQESNNTRRRRGPGRRRQRVNSKAENKESNADAPTDHSASNVKTASSDSSAAANKPTYTPPAVVTSTSAENAGNNPHRRKNVSRWS